MKINKSAKCILAFLLIILITTNQFSQFTYAYDSSGDPITEQAKVVDIYINASSDASYTATQMKTLLQDKLNNQNKATGETTYRVLDQSDVRINTNMVNIDTTDLSNWYVYDHYGSNTGSTYANSNVTSSSDTSNTPPASWISTYGQPSVKRPYYAYRESNGSRNPTVYNIKDFVNLDSSLRQYVAPIDTHIYSYVDAEKKPAMTFVGYGSPAYCDFLFYPTTSTGTKEVKFTVDSSYVATHTLSGAGFLINTGIDPTTKVITGYILYYRFSSPTAVASLTLYKINANVTATLIHQNGFLNYCTPVSTINNPAWSSLMDIDLTISPTDLVVKQKPSSSSTYTQVMNATGLIVSANQGFGPIVQYTGHNCAQSSMFKFSNLEMSFIDQSTSVLDALSKSNYLSNSEKYFVNIQSKDGDSTLNSADWEGLTRLRQENIRYVTNKNNPFLLDGGINSTTAPNANNGKSFTTYTSADDLASKIAAYILGDNTWVEPTTPLEVSKPVAINALVANPNNSATNSQVLQVVRNYVGTGLDIFSEDSSVSASGRTIANYYYKTTNPDGTTSTVNMSSPATKSSPIMTLKSSSVLGEYTVELIVTDSADVVSTPNVSKFTLISDDTAPAISLTNPSSTTSAFSGNNISYSLNDAGEGVMAYSYTYSGTKFIYNGNSYANQSVTTPETVLTSSQATLGIDNATIPYGIYTLTINAFDKAGNKSTKSFNINNFIDINSTSPVATLGYATATYDGTAKTPSVDLKSGGNTLVQNTDYTVNYSNNTNAGTATVSITGIGKYSGTITKTFTIEPAVLTILPEPGQTKYYGQADGPISYTYVGNVTGETPAFTGALSRFVGSIIGNYQINAGTLSLANNGVFIANNYRLVLSTSTVNFGIKNFAPDIVATSTPNGQNNWFTGNVILNAPTGYSLSASNLLTQNNWNTILLINSEEGSNKTGSYYLRDNTTGAITDVKSFGYKVDKTAPTNITASYSTNKFYKVLNTVSFGLFFKNSVTVTLTADDATSGVNNFTYTLAGSTPKTTTSSFEVSPEFIGNFTVYATDNAGNQSASVSYENFVINAQAPSDPTVTSGAYTSDTWTSNSVSLTISGSTALSGIKKYQYSTNGSDWTDLTSANAVITSTSATASTPFNVTKVVFDLTDTQNNSYYFRAVSNSDVNGDSSSPIKVKIDKVIPGISVEKDANYSSDWSNKDVTFTLKNVITNNSGAHYQYSISNGTEWKDIAGNSLTISSDTNETYIFRAVTGADVKSAASSPYVVKIQKTVPQNGTFTITPVSPPGQNNWYTQVPSITITAPVISANASPVKTYYKLYTAEEPQNGTEITGNNQPVITSDGVYTLKLWTVDGAGNQSLEQIQKISVDKIGAQGSVSIAQSKWTGFLDKITFGLFLKDTASITLDAVDATSGVDTVEYYQSNNAMTIDEVKAITSWSQYKEVIKLSPVDKQAFVYYGKITDKAGNISYISSDGATFDTTLPVIKGITDKGTYYVDQAVNIEDSNIDTIKVNGKDFVNGSKLIGNVNQTYIIEVKDKAGNTVTYTVNSKPITDLDATIDQLTLDNVKSSDEPAIEDVLFKITAELTTTNNGASEDEINQLNAIRKKCEDLLAKVKDIADKIQDYEDAVKDITLENFQKSDISIIENTVFGLRGILTNNGENLTDIEENAVQEIIDQYSKINSQINEVTSLEAVIKGLPAPDNVTKNDGKNIQSASDSYNRLSAHQKEILDASLYKYLNDVMNALKQISLYDAPTGVKVEGIEGTSFALMTELVVTDVTSQLPQETKDIFLAGIKRVAADNEIAELYDVKLLLNGQKIQPDGKIKITIKASVEMNNYTDLKVVYVADDGTTTIIPSDRNGSEFSFVTTHFSYYGLIGNPINSADTNETSPKSGDSTSFMPYLVMEFITFSGIFGMMYVKRRKKRSDI